MQQSSRLPINQLDLYRPACPKCGERMWIARIEPSDDPGHDLRTFGCVACGNADVMKVKFK